MNLSEYMAFELIEKIKNQETSVREVIETTFEKIAEIEHLIHAFVSLSKEQALEKAALIDKHLKNTKKPGRRYGLPLANKDLICVKNYLKGIILHLVHP